MSARFGGGKDWGERAKGSSGEGAVGGKGQSAADVLLLP